MEGFISYDSGVPGVEIGRAVEMSVLFLFAMLRIGGFVIAAPVFGARFVPLQVIEVAELINAHMTGGKCTPDFREAWAVQQTVEAMQTSSQERGWINVGGAT